MVRARESGYSDTAAEQYTYERSWTGFRAALVMFAVLGVTAAQSAQRVS
jgi:hypothetical protein